VWIEGQSVEYPGRNGQARPGATRVGLQYSAVGHVHAQSQCRKNAGARLAGGRIWRGRSDAAVPPDGSGTEAAGAGRPGMGTGAGEGERASGQGGSALLTKTAKKLRMLEANP